MFEVLPFERAFTESNNVSVRLPILSSSPLSLHRTLPSARGYPQQLHHLPERWMLAMKGAAGIYTGTMAELGYQHHGCEKHSGIFSDHKWSHLWFYVGSKRKLM